MATKRCWFWCMGVAGRGRPVAQPGGPTSGFALHLVCYYYAQLQTRDLVVKLRLSQRVVGLVRQR